MQRNKDELEKYEKINLKTEYYANIRNNSDMVKQNDEVKRVESILKKYDKTRVGV
mgnify:CR=1 FL=1|jgi:hypothetical protein